MIGWLTAARALVLRHRRLSLALVALAAIGGAAASLYAAGRAKGRAEAAADHFRIVRDTVVDSIRVTVESLRVDTVRLAAMLPRADSLRPIARQEIAIARHSDSLRAATVVPAPGASSLPPIPRVVLDACSDALTADSLATAALRTALTHCGTHGRLETRRADLAEARIAQMAHEQPRMGWRTGMLLGASAATVLVVVLHSLLN